MLLDEQAHTDKKKKIREVLPRMRLTHGGAEFGADDPDLTIEGSVLTYSLDKKERKWMVKFVFPTAVESYGVKLQVNSVVPLNVGMFTDNSATLPIDATVEAAIVFVPANAETPSKPPLPITIRTRQKGGGL